MHSGQDASGNHAMHPWWDRRRGASHSKKPFHLPDLPHSDGTGRGERLRRAGRIGLPRAQAVSFALPLSLGFESVYEIADLMYHVMVLMVEMGISEDEIIAELASRHVIDKKVKQEKMTK